MVNEPDGLTGKIAHHMPCGSKFQVGKSHGNQKFDRFDPQRDGEHTHQKSFRGYHPYFSAFDPCSQIIAWMLPCVPATRGRSWLSSRSRRFRAVRVHCAWTAVLQYVSDFCRLVWEFGENWLRWTAARMWSLPKSLFDSPTWTVIASTCLDRPNNSAASKSHEMLL